MKAKATRDAVVAVLASSGVVPAGTVAAQVQASNAAQLADTAKVAVQAKLIEEQTAIRAALHLAREDGKVPAVVTLAKNVAFVLLYLVGRKLCNTDTLPGGKLVCTGDGAPVDAEAKLYACLAFRNAGGLLKGRDMQIGAPSVALTLLAGSGDKPLQAGGYQGCPSEYHRNASCSYGLHAEELLDSPDHVKAATAALLAAGLKPTAKTDAK